MRRRRHQIVTQRGGADLSAAPPPWLHQTAGVGRLVEQPTLMLDYGMGTGKSRTVVLYLETAALRRVLVLCPKSVIPVWPDQLDAWAERRWSVLQLDQRAGDARSKAYAVKQHVELAPERALVVVNYDSAWREPLSRELFRAKFDAVILDESHRVKDPGGRASRWVAQLARVIPRRVLLTGTPMPHSPMDLFAQFRVLNPAVFGTSFVAFRARYGIVDTRGGFPKIVGYRNQEELSQRAARYVIRADRSVLKLPPAIHERVLVELEPKARAAYDELEEHLSTAIGQGIVTAANALVVLLRLQQLTGGFLPVEDPDAAGTHLVSVDTSKRDALEDLLTDLEPQRRVVVFCRFRGDLDAVHEVARAVGRTSCELSGRRHDIQGKWRPGPETVAAVQIQAGGLGIDLTCASVCVFYSVGFSLGDYEQALARVHRPGQTETTNYYHFVARDTVDEAVYGSLQKKEQVIQSVIALMSRARGEVPQ